MACSLPGSSVHGDSPDKNTGVGCHALLQEIFLIQGSNPCFSSLLYCRQILYHWANCKKNNLQKRHEVAYTSAKRQPSEMEAIDRQSSTVQCIKAIFGEMWWRKLTIGHRKWNNHPVYSTQSTGTGLDTNSHIPYIILLQGDITAPKSPIFKTFLSYCFLLPCCKRVARPWTPHL